MGAFRYQAINAKGRVVKGTLESDTDRQVRTRLRQQQLKPISVEKVSASHLTAKHSGNSSVSKLFKLRLGGVKIAVKDLTLLTRQLASLVQSGMPLAESLQAVAKQTRKDAVKDVVLHVRSRVLEGRSLAQAFADYPRIFDSMYRAMVNAGEQAGFLGPVLERLSEYAETSHAARQQLKSAMVYPIILVIVCIGIVIALMVFVVPQLTSVFTRAKQELPWMTQLLINVSDFLQQHGLLCFAVVIAWIVISRWWLNREQNLRKWHKLQLKLPLIGHIVVQADSSRFASTLGMLISSGVPLLNSLRISNQTMANSILCEQAEQVAIAVEEGSSLHKALDKTEVFPPLMVQMAASGEANGTLSEQLDYSAKSQQRELDLQLSAALGVIEPITIVLMGFVIGFIMAAIIVPIANMSNLI
ncbi:type II secretion system protein GspF [Candidatus Endobugula sertula]|uniref:Type II secretion system protein GspF n=1 Tax=Candidatus Endobugula sertula TaxID=62101 RepID=A0A1D2QSP1_9GAMM|nr:type II secretion system protein GspF [Candidatus Endobugula sertula]